MHNFAWLLAASLLVGPDNQTPRQDSSADRARRIAERVEPDEQNMLKVRIEGQEVVVSGTVGDAEDARRVLKAVLKEEGVRSVWLDLNVGGYYVLVRSRQEYLGRLNWMDQFDNQPYRIKQRLDVPEWSRGSGLRDMPIFRTETD